MSPYRLFAYGLLVIIVLSPLVGFLIPEENRRECVSYFEDRRTSLCFAQFVCGYSDEPKSAFTNVECTKEVRALIERGRK